MKYRRLFPSVAIAVVLIGAALFFVLSPLLRHGFFASDDGEWMIIRLSAFYQSLASGQFPVRFLGRLNFSYGYPVSNFLYPGFLYIGSVLHIIGLSFVDAIKAILFLSVSTSAILLFGMLRKRFSLWPSILGTLSFVMAPYLLFDLYVRGSVGEVVGIAAAMLTLFAVINEIPWLLVPAFGFLIISHNTVALLSGAGIMLAVWAMKHRVRDGIGLLLGLGTASFFWLPALVEKSLVRFDGIDVSNPTAYLVTLKNAPLLGFSFMVALAVLLGFRKKLTRIDAVAFALTLLGLSMALPISQPLWQIRGFAQLVQFPYRFLILPILFGPWMVAFVLEQMKGWKRMALALLSLLLLLLGSIPYIQSVQYVDRPLGFYTTNEGTTTVANEYMPKWVSDLPNRRPVETLEVLDGDAELSKRTFNGERFDVAVKARETTLLQINKIFYPGWGITIDDTLVPITFNNPRGVIRVVVPNGIHTVRAAFRETPFRFAADVISLISVIGYLLYIRRSKGNA